MIGDRELLSVWDAAQDTHPAMRPALLLRAAGGVDAAETLPIPARDRLLLALRERWFGSAYESVIACDACGAAIELAFDGRAMTLEDAPETREAGGVAYRLPDSTDLLAVAACATEDEARRMLVARCVLVESPASKQLEAVANALDEEDDLRLAVTCPDCGASSDVAFDPGAYLWHEVDAAAIRVLREVDALASAYGWSEEQILALPRRRRALYLRMVTR